ncbi:uncharacterized protein VTP21DRAFT_9797 [Calcarisporiella thermophila]|uniref:uncharacterized protein n=1 Tax=Calcarisporiella thermophila TaxID=911321 RepID=UPI003742A104
MSNLKKGSDTINVNTTPVNESINIEVSSGWDGKASIEHQIEIHVHDLFDIKDNQGISLSDVLAGLRYVLDHRLRGNRHPNLDFDLMKRLCEALLIFTGEDNGGLLRRRPTVEGDEAFLLFGEFFQEVEEFRQAVSQKNIADLRFALKIHRRLQPYSTSEQKQAAVALLRMFSDYFEWDWRDLVKEDELDDAIDVMEEFKDKTAKLPDIGKGVLLPPQALYFDRNVSRVLKMFRTDIENGLSDEVIPSLRQHYGPNKLPEPPKPSIFKMILNQLKDFMVLLLIVAAIVTGAKGDLKAMAVLLIVVVLNTVIGFSQEYKANKALEALRNFELGKATVIRNGKQHEVPFLELVPGDLVVLEEGVAVPADLRLVEVSQLEVVESVLTGESVPVQKDTEAIKAQTRKLPLGDCKCIGFMSTLVARGRAKGIVVRTGNYTEIGKISAAISSQSKTKTPMQRKLATLGKWLVALAILLCVIVVVAGVLYKKDTNQMVNIGIRYLLTILPFVFYFWYKGLVAVVTVTMAIGVKQMAARKCIVRTLPAVETLGSVTFICSDKTGTLTEGKMGVSEIWTSDDAIYSLTESTSLNPTKGEIIHVNKNSARRPSQSDSLVESSTQSTEADESKKLSTLATDITADETPSIGERMDEVVPRGDYTKLSPTLFLSLMVSCLCNNSSIEAAEGTENWKGVGDPTEVALIVAAQKAGFPKVWWRQLGIVRLSERAFDSERKVMSVLVRINGDEKEEKKGSSEYDHDIILAKGAPEQLLRRCVNYLPTTSTSSSDDRPTTLRTQLESKPVEMDDDFEHLVSNQASVMAAKGLRVLGLAYRRIPRVDGQIDPNEPPYAEKELTFVGLIGLIDPPRSGVAESIKKCQEAGIHVVMITGDHVVTATAIAYKLGIMKKDVRGMNRAISGQELDVLSDDAIAELTPFPNVFARVSPDNKLKIVQALKKRKDVVAMTGDGVNDAPAIKAADVGVAMGIGGTEVTKQAADIVLADDNFTTIVAGVEEGRKVFDNIMKFIIYLLSCNTAEIIVMLVASVAGLPTPFTPIMILWANIIADVPPAMAIAMEPAEIDLMQRKPRDPQRKILTLSSSLNLLLKAFLMGGLSMGLFLIALYVEGIQLRDAQSLAFMGLTTLQLLFAPLTRTVRESIFLTNPFSNVWMIYALILSFALLIMGNLIPPWAEWLEMNPLPGFAWAKIVICCGILVVFSEIEKLIRRIYYRKYP